MRFEILRCLTTGKIYLLLLFLWSLLSIFIWKLHFYENLFTRMYACISRTCIVYRMHLAYGTPHNVSNVDSCVLSNDDICLRIVVAICFTSLRVEIFKRADTFRINLNAFQPNICIIDAFILSLINYTT